jgi:hypothetical protein
MVLTSDQLFAVFLIVVSAAVGGVCIYARRALDRTEQHERDIALIRQQLDVKRLLDAQTQELRELVGADRRLAVLEERSDEHERELAGAGETVHWHGNVVAVLCGRANLDRSDLGERRPPRPLRLPLSRS